MDNFSSTVKRPVAQFLSLLLCLSCLTASAGTLVQFHLYFGVNQYVGDLDVELFDKDKPITVGNFLRLVETNAYQNSFFHRCIPGSVIQGGTFAAFNPFDTDIITPTYSNLFSVPNFGTITNEFGVGPLHSNTFGTIAMAKTSDPNSAASGFFFNLTDNSAAYDNTNTAGGYVVFGQTVRDTNNNLGLFAALHPGVGDVDLTQTYGTSNPVTTAFPSLPNDTIGSSPPPYDDLVYFTVTILTANVNLLPGGARQISWESIKGVTNNVEFTTNLPPTWHVLFSTNGNGGPITITDSATVKTNRFYRIHVLY